MNIFTDFKLLLHFLKGHRFLAGIVLFLMIFSGILESLNLALLFPILNYGLNLPPSRTLQAIDYFIRLFNHENLLIASCYGLIVVTIISTVLKIVFNYYSNLLIARVVSSFQKELFNKISSADYKFFIKSQQGKLIYAGTVAPIGVANNIYYVVRLLNSLLTCAFFVVLLTIMAWQGMLFIGLLGALYVFFINVLLKKIVNKYSHLTVDEDRKRNVVLNEFITGIKAIKAFNNAKFWEKKYFSAVEKSVKFDFNVKIGRVFPDSFLKFIFFVSLGIAGILIGKFNSQDFIIWLPVVGTFVGVVSRLIPYVNLVGNDVVAIARFMPDTKIVYDMLHEKMQTLPQGSIEFTTFSQEIVFHDVRFKYDGMDEELLKGVSFQIPKNKVTALVGPSGSGKSTIVGLILKLYETEKGKISIDGLNIRDLTNQSYLSKIGYVGQETFIFNGTVKDNILFGRMDIPEEMVIQAAKLANAHDFIQELEKGYDTIVGDAGAKLSGGQRQRVAIARAILTKPEIIILDEATSSLDNISEKAVQQAIEVISHLTTIFIIAHRLSTVQHADKIIVIEKGQIVEQGSHEELLQKGKLYSKLYALK